MELQVHELAQRARRGDAAGVELELHQGLRQDESPSSTPEARVLFAAMLARRGEMESALEALRPVHTPAGNTVAEQLRLRIAVLIEADLLDTARRLARELFAKHAALPGGAGTREWIEAIEAPGATTLPDVSPAAVEQLAAELLDDPDVVRSLVAALKQQATGLNRGTGVPPVVGPKDNFSGSNHSVVPIDGERDTGPSAQLHPEAATKPITLLRAAIEHIVDDYACEPRRFVTLCVALADLAMLADDRGDARRWAHRGLKVDPYCAALALVLVKCDDEPTENAEKFPGARQALARVARRHPGYPDVRAAMIRRAFAEGRIASARRRLGAWLRRDPDSPLANQLRQELAA